MNVTLRQSIAIYARASIAWFGDKAAEKTAEKIKVLAARGDDDGVAVFDQVKAEIGRLQSSHRRRNTFVRHAK
jgi:hypothetical protein